MPPAPFGNHQVQGSAELKAGPCLKQKRGIAVRQAPSCLKDLFDYHDKRLLDDLLCNLLANDDGYDSYGYLRYHIYTTSFKLVGNEQGPCPPKRTQALLHKSVHLVLSVNIYSK